MSDASGTAKKPAALKPTPLHARHLASGARMVPYAGWDMPVEYSGITAEHLAVRSRAGVFDVSHMGEIEIAGKDALKTVQHLTSNDASRLKMGQAQYSALLTPEGTFVDDILVYRLGPNHFMLVINAANTAKAFDWITTQAKIVGEAAVVDSSPRYALIAVQGPAALDTVQPLTGADLGSVRPYWFTYGEVAQARALISRTGYTGEDGFEIFVPPNTAERVWQALLQTGQAAGVVPCGLGARDTLRLEAAMRLYGQDIDETTTPVEAGLAGIVGWNKPDFVGAERLRAQRAAGPERRLVGLEMSDRGIARHGYAVLKDGAPVGTVTSGTQTPFLKKAIAMAYVPAALATTGAHVEVDVRGRATAATVVPLPFYKRPRGIVAGL
ncbi:MAG TPA: glycine cleavage system aminomethyltransferase GcvT [Vicinamibacterales bacterium]|jgi:aminomethyltransferase|nr:glycine cleavage system aminomethyltransferase GcvT [Vicinamibacterales bacterium]